MLTSKQRAYLRNIGNGYEPVVQIGKGGLTPNVLQQADQALEARELIKVRILPNADVDVEETPETMAARTSAEVVQRIGRNFLLYRRAKNPKLELT